MKSKKLFSSIFAAFVIISFLGAFAPMNTNGAVISPDSWFYASPYVVMAGYQPDLSLAMFSVDMVSLNDIYNDTMPAVSLVGTSFFDQDLASEDYQTDSITREFSSDIASKIDIESAGGIYQTLQMIGENDFSQYAVDRDTTIFTYTTAVPFNETIVNELQDVDPDWNITHFDCRKMYTVLTFDRALVDAFFAEAKAQDGYGLIADEHSTSTQMITSLFDNVFSNHIFDIIYSPVNVSDYASDWSVAQEVHAVMGGNATDTSILGVTRTVSMRDAAIGHIGQKLAPTTTIELDSYPTEGESPIYGFEQTATTYTIYLDIKSDYTTGNTVDGNLSGLFSLFQPGEITSGAQLISYYGIGGLIGLASGLAVAFVTLLIARDSKNKYWISGAVGFAAAFISFVLYLLFTTTVVLT